MRHTCQPETIRNVVHWALHELEFDYAISTIVVGPSHSYEIILWDRPRNSCRRQVGPAEKQLLLDTRTLGRGTLERAHD